MYEPTVGFTLVLTAQLAVQPTVLQKQLPEVVVYALCTEVLEMDEYMTAPALSTPRLAAHVWQPDVQHVVMSHSASVAPHCAPVVVAVVQGSPECV